MAHKVILLMLHLWQMHNEYKVHSKSQWSQPLGQELDQQKVSQILKVYWLQMYTKNDEYKK